MKKSKPVPEKIQDNIHLWVSLGSDGAVRPGSNLTRM